MPILLLTLGVVLALPHSRLTYLAWLALGLMTVVLVLKKGKM